MCRFATCFLVCIYLIAGWAEPTSAAKRVALVIGNSVYEHATPLKNPKNDAEDVAARLATLGFDVVKGIDLTHRGFAQTIADFKKKLDFADVSLFFYAGHGLQVNGRNYLAPVDAKLDDSTALAFEAVQLGTILQLMERRRRTNLVFLDACRDNPLARNLARGMGTRSNAVGRGLARVETGVGTFIAFATQPGNVALDGDDRNNSPFTRGLMDHIATPGLDVALMMRRVRRQVIKETGGRQVPWQHSSLTAPFTFESDAVAAKVAAAAPEIVKEPKKAPRFNPKSMELSFWDSIRHSSNPALFSEYLRRYPDGTFALIANAKLEELELSKPKAVEQKAAALPQAAPVQPEGAREAVSPLQGRELALALQTELKRVKCYSNSVDGDWGRGSRAALKNFSRYAKLNLATEEPTMDALNAVGGSKDRVCPLTCGVQYRVQGDQCVKKTCPSGQRLNSRGQCIKLVVKKVVKQPAARSAPKKKKSLNSDDECRKKWSGYSTMSAYCP